MSNDELKTLFTNLASIILPLFAQRFPHIGSLYFAPSSSTTATTATVLSPVSSSSTICSAIATPTPVRPTIKGFSFLPLLPATPSSCDTPKAAPSHGVPKYVNATVATSDASLVPSTSPPDPSPSPGASSSKHTYHIGPIISWPFFGSNRGFLHHPTEINRGPWSTTASYLASCTARETTSVIHESEGRSASHRLHLDPAEIHSSRHHHMEAFPDDADSDGSDEWDAQESEEEWEDCVGDAMYSDYRRMQRGTFLVAHIRRREEAVRHEMGRWMRLMERLGACRGRPSNGEAEEFGLDCHDLSLENVFVDEKDHTKIVSRTLGSELTYRLTLGNRLALSIGNRRRHDRSGHVHTYLHSCNRVHSPFDSSARQSLLSQPDILPPSLVLRLRTHRHMDIHLPSRPSPPSGSTTNHGVPASVMHTAVSNGTDGKRVW